MFVDTRPTNNWTFQDPHDIGCFRFNNPLVRPTDCAKSRLVATAVWRSVHHRASSQILAKGWCLRDVGCFIFDNPLPERPPILRLENGVLDFGNQECTFGIIANLPGLVASDPAGLRLLGPGGQGCILTFGPTDDCRIFVDPFQELTGLVASDPNGLRLLGPNGQGCILTFGPTDDCRIFVDPLQELTGLVASDPRGLRLLGPNGEGCILTFGPDDLCRILVDPQRDIPGLILQDPRLILLENPLEPGGANVQVDGALQAIEFVQNSSRELKENIRTIDKPLEKVKQLRGVYFDWKHAQGADAADMGLIAEEVDEVLSEVTVAAEDGKVEGVKYANLVALVIEGMKEQQTQIENQQEVIEQLQKELAELRAQE